jgi:PadR family transcriptional regulator, regulatory protein PadR
MTDKTDLLQGTLDLLVLRVLRSQELHGWGISKRIREISHDVLQINQGSLYPALYRLEKQDYIESDWGVSEEGRRAKFYRLTSLGKRQLTDAENAWRRFSLAVETVLTTA